MKRSLILLLAAGLFPLAADAVVTGPYTPDANTIALYNFDEASGPTDPGNPFANTGTGGSTMDFTSTGGPDGRAGTTGGGYGASSFNGFGSSFNVLASGDGTVRSTGFSGSPNGGGASTGSTRIQQADLQGVNGTFTYEAMIRTATITPTGAQMIISHDDNNNSTRGFNFTIFDSLLRFDDGYGNLVTASIPTVGSHAFDPSDWFHVAVTYTGDEGVAGNMSLYWTAMDSDATEANLIGTGTLAADVTDENNRLGVGTFMRSPFRRELEGFIDEVRISNVARSADDFLFAIPEPTSAALLGLGGLVLMARRRRHRYPAR
ncbi:MAG: LamG-like jellyroll fold domain-containing protein [Verrucomicrobiota bacterium]